MNRAISWMELAPRNLTASLAVCAAALLAASCGEPPAGPDPAPGPEFHHRPGHGGGGGGGGNEFSATIQVRNASGDRITSQGSATYEDDRDGNLRIRDDGILLWNVNEGRGFRLDFTDAIPGTGGDGLPADSTVTRVGALRVLASEDPADELDGHLLGMADGDSLPANLKTRAEFDADGTYQLRFQRGAGGSEAIADSIASGSSFLTIIRNSDSGPCSTVAEECWTIEALVTGDGPGTQDDWGMVFHKTGNGANKTFTDEGSFHMPFRWTVICADCPPASGDADDPPSVTVTNPADGDTVSGTVTVTANASDDGAVSQVEFFVDGSSIGADSDGSDGWSALWDTSAEADASSHAVGATATDDAGQTASDEVTVTVDNSAPATMHIGDLDGSSTNEGRTWTASVDALVVDAGGSPVADATVSGSWSGGASGSDSCLTGGDGRCSVTMGGIRKNRKSATFTVDDVSHTDLTFDATANTDPDGDSDGTSITVSKP